MERECDVVLLYCKTAKRLRYSGFVVAYVVDNGLFHHSARVVKRQLRRAKY